ncbi:MAG: 4-hydroxythreonine-4-phosphate dehydrogenase PdxA [Christensenellales bacterium]|jgi:4-hydroxythreonine-4-phosphate dehydrogenase
MVMIMLPTIGITQGDPAGIGAEVIVKALALKEVRSICTPVVIGDRAAVSDALRMTGLKLRIHICEKPADALESDDVINLMDLALLEDGFEYKKISAAAGDASFRYIRRAIELALAGEIKAVVTAPISKEALHMAGFKYAGHTEIFAELTGTKDYAMLLTSGSLRVIHVSTHVSLAQACKRATRERVGKVIRLGLEACRQMGVENPRIAVAGLNPHSSENGLFGTEEASDIIPAIEEAKGAGINVFGPLPADTVFVRAAAGEFDMVVAMYHDQGHIPVKLLGFKVGEGAGNYSQVSGVNATVGLPIIRTSVDHGTAFDRAGEGRANEGSMVEAIEMAVQMTRKATGGGA